MSRVLLVTNIFPPEIGGPAIFIDRLAHELQAAGHAVTVVCSTEGGEQVSDAARPFRVRRVDLSNRYRYEIAVRLVLARELATHRHVLVNGLERYVSSLARLLGRRYVLKIVGDPVWETARNWGLTTETFDAFQAMGIVPERLAGVAAQRRAALEQARIVVTPSAYLSAVVHGWGVSSERLRVVPNGVPLNEAAIVPPQRGDGPLEIVYCGRLTNWKGVETALLATKDLPGVQLRVIGDGPEQPMLVGLASQLGLDASEIFLGRVVPADLLHLLRRAHVLVLPSAYEGLSHTLLEGAASGLVPVVSDIGGNRAVVKHGVNGLLTSYGDVQALRQALMVLRDDDDHRRRLAQAAIATARAHDFAETVQGTMALLELS